MGITRYTTIRAGRTPLEPVLAQSRFVQPVVSLPLDLDLGDLIDLGDWGDLGDLGGGGRLRVSGGGGSAPTRLGRRRPGLDSPVQGEAQACE